MARLSMGMKTIRAPEWNMVPEIANDLWPPSRHNFCFSCLLSAHIAAGRLPPLILQRRNYGNAISSLSAASFLFWFMWQGILFMLPHTRSHRSDRRNVMKIPVPFLPSSCNFIKSLKQTFFPFFKPSLWLIMCGTRVTSNNNVIFIAWAMTS